MMTMAKNSTASETVTDNATDMAADSAADVTVTAPKRKLRFDRKRPTPWKYLLTWGALVVGLMVITGLITGPSQVNVGYVLTAVMGGALYVGIGWVLVKLGWDPQRLAQQRGEVRAARNRARGDKRGSKRSTSSATSANAPKPIAATKRTNLTNHQAKPKARR
jgi:hypothetical protein